MHMCVDIHVCIVHMCTGVWRYEDNEGIIFMNYLLFFETVFHWLETLTSRLSWGASEPQESACLCLLSVRLIRCYQAFFFFFFFLTMGSVGLTQVFAST